tara:strand:- start:223 stop:483 length:261 start_codon:yes stop_codon:yes gene_type:complete
MSVFEIYLALMLPLHTIDEIYNCNNIPNTGDPNGSHLICNWTDEDYEWYVTDDGKKSYRLKQQCQNDNYFERKARNKYWEQRRLNE